MLRRIFHIPTGHTKRHLFLNTLRSMVDNNAATTASSIAFFALFSLFPLLLILTVVSNHIFTAQDLEGVALRKVLRIFPGARSFLRENLAGMPLPSGMGLLVTTLAFVWASSWMTSLLEAALNRAWHVTHYRGFWKSRLLAFWMIAVAGGLLLLSVLITLFLSRLQRLTSQVGLDDLLIFGESGTLWRIGLGLAGVFITFLGFLITYWLVPHTEVKISEVIPGALAATVLWQGANYIFAWLVPRFNYAHIHGSLAAVVVLLTWTYTSCLILLLGAQMSALMHRVTPERLRPMAQPAVSPK